MKNAFVSLALAAVLALAPISAFASESSVESLVEEIPDETVVRLAGMKGPTTIGMVGLLDKADRNETENNYEFTLAGAADEITPLLLKGDLDIAAVPLNLASVLYAKSEGALELAAVNTLGVLYIVENNGDSVSSLEDLKGRTILATGKGSTPEYALRYLLTSAGLDPDTDVTFDWKNEPTETVAQMSSTDEDMVAMLPQPYVTAAKAKLPDLNVVLDLTECWDALDNGSRLMTSGLVVRREFAEEHPEALESFLADYEESSTYVNENPAEAAVLVEELDIAKAAIAEKAIPECNIVCITGDEMKAVVPGYLEVLFEQNPASIGGALPGEDFYY